MLQVTFIDPSDLLIFISSCISCYCSKTSIAWIGWAQIGDEVVNAQIEKDADAMKSTTIPSKLKAVIKFGYDEGIKNRLSQQGQTFQQWIEGVLTHAQAHFKHPSLGTQIEFEVG